MPYKDDRDRCESHIQYLRKQLAQAKRAVKKIPALEAQIAKWQARLREGRTSGRRVPKQPIRCCMATFLTAEDDEPTLRRYQVWRY